MLGLMRAIVENAAGDGSEKPTNAYFTIRLKVLIAAAADFSQRHISRSSREQGEQAHLSLRLSSPPHSNA